MKIERVIINDTDGCIIQFDSLDNIPLKTKLSITYMDEFEHYFEVMNITTNDNLLTIKAKEVGYWCDKFDNDKDFDIRDLLKLEINIITDRDKLNKIEEESCWC